MLEETDAGRAYLYFSSSPPIKPTLFQVKDVPNDQGSKLKIQFARSGYDIKGTNKITSYKILRSYPPGTLGFSWETVSEITAVKVPYYTFTDNTPTDSGSGMLVHFTIGFLLKLLIRMNTGFPASCPVAA